jgi:hypothetical protein
MDHRLDVEDEDGLHMEGSDRGVHLGNGIGTENVILVGRRRRRRGGASQHKLGMLGLLSSVGCLSGKMIHLDHQSVSLSDNSRLGIGGGCLHNNAFGFEAVSVVGVGGDNLSDDGHGRRGG